MYTRHIYMTIYKKKIYFGRNLRFPMNVFVGIVLYTNIYVMSKTWNSIVRNII